VEKDSNTEQKNRSEEVVQPSGARHPPFAVREVEDEVEDEARMVVRGGGAGDVSALPSIADS
jgi:hypothetical protein